MRYLLFIGLFPRAAVAAFCHDGLMKAGSKVVWKLVNLVVTVNFNGLLGGIHDHVAFVAPMEVFIQLHSQVVVDLAVKIIGQLF